MNSGSGVVGGAAPTGCYKCGRPGHWSRDCPSDPTSNNADDQNPPLPSNNSKFNSKSGSRSNLPPQKQKQKPPRTTRPKLTPDLLLSDAGIGHILRYFPKALKCRGRGHEVNDLRHLLHLYAEWHSRLLPYYSFDQFIHKVEQVAASKRVKVCIRDLREKIANGVDPSKLHELQSQQNSLAEQGDSGDLNTPSTTLNENDMHNETIINSHEDIAQDLWEAAMKDPTSEPVRVDVTTNSLVASNNVPDRQEDSNVCISNPKNQMSEEQKARMEANRLKAIERAAARSRTLHASQGV